MPYAWRCETCRKTITPRGGVPPRFCPRCGARVGGAPIEGSPAGLWPPPVVRQTPPQVFVALFLSLVAYALPGLGLFLGALAVFLGGNALGRIRRAPHLLGGKSTALTAVILGAAAVLLQLLRFGRF